MARLLGNIRDSELEDLMLTAADAQAQTFSDEAA